MDSLVSKTADSVRRIAVLSVLALMVAGIAGGCAPKRVVPSDRASESSGTRKRLSRTEPPPIKSTRSVPDADDGEARGVATEGCLHDVIPDPLLGLAGR